MGTKEDSATRERKALRYSLVVATALAVLAAFWGWISQSQVILLDGVYALIGMVLTALSLRVSRIADSGPTARFPFGKEAISRKELTHEEDLGTGTLGLLGNIVWFVLAGVWLAIGHVVSAVACFVTIIGIPFAIQHLKLAGIALAPVGKTIVSKEVAAAAREANARAQVGRMRGD